MPEIKATPLIDSAELKKHVDLLELIGRDTHLTKIATTRGGEYAGPCPFCGGNDRLRVQPEKGAWWCRQCQPDGRWQDAIAYVMRRDNVSFLEACKTLGAGPVDDLVKSAKTSIQVIQAIQVYDDSPPDPAWQNAARAYCERAADVLWSEAGAGALAYLREKRGLTDETIRLYGLGYQPADGWRSPDLWGLDGKKVWLSKGITIPCQALGALWYVKTRRPEPGDELADYVGSCESRGKYPQVRGSRPALFGADELAGRKVVVLTEGEFDAMLLFQEAGELAGVATLGSAGAALAGRWLWVLRGATRILAAYDIDPAGARGLSKIEAISARIRSARPVGSKDLTDMHRAGSSLRGWLAFNLRKHAPAAVESVISRPAPADLAAFLEGGSGYGWPALLARGVFVRCGENDYRAFADTCTAGQLGSVFWLVVDEPESGGAA